MKKPKQKTHEEIRLIPPHLRMEEDYKILFEDSEQRIEKLDKKNKKLKEEEDRRSQLINQICNACSHKKGCPLLQLTEDVRKSLCYFARKEIVLIQFAQMVDTEPYKIDYRSFLASEKN